MSPVWHDDDAFWEAVHPLIFRAEAWIQGEERAADVAHLAGVDPGASILDLACGPGRFTLPLAALGYRMTGVDRTRAYLDEARTRGKERGLDVEWVQADMADFERPAAFDAVLNLFTSWGYFEDEADNIAVLARMRRNLRPGGRLVLETMGKEVLARIFQPFVAEELPDGVLLVRSHGVEEDWTRVTNTWRLIRHGREAHRITFRHWIYSARELRERLEGVGFSDVQVFGDLLGAPYDHAAKRLVVTARA